MERYFKKRTLEESNAQDNLVSINKQTSLSSLPHVEINVDDLEADPGLRKNIYAYDANDRESSKIILAKRPLSTSRSVFSLDRFWNKTT